MITKLNLALLLTLASAAACGASTDKAESETHFLSCETNSECEDAEVDSVCVSGRCVAADEAMGDDDAEDDASDDDMSDDDDANSDPGDDDVSPGPDDSGGIPGSTGPGTPPGPPPSATASGSPTPTTRPSAPMGGGGPAPSPGSAGSSAAGAGGAGPEVGVGGRSGSGGGGSDAVCESLMADPETAEPVLISVLNERDVPIVLGGPVSCDPTSITIEELDVDDPGFWGGSHCLLACNLVLDGGGGCTADCPSAPPVVIGPGETGTIEWPGLLARTMEVPEQCCTTDYCPTECPLVVAAQPGRYHAVIALTEVSEEQAAACSEQQVDCPNPFDGATTYEEASSDFELGAGDIIIPVAPVSPQQ